MLTPAQYETWYHTPRGGWIAGLEFSLLQHLMQAESGATLLDVGCGSGYFTRRFRGLGLAVTGVDSEPSMLEYARQQSHEIEYRQGRAEDLPFADNSFDFVVAVTSLCFTGTPEYALQEMWRVAKSVLVLGLLNRHGLLYWQKRNAGSYAGARWDSRTDVNIWVQALVPKPCKLDYRSTIFLPGGGRPGRLIERLLSNRLLLGGFLAVCLEKK